MNKIEWEKIKFKKSKKDDLPIAIMQLTGMPSFPPEDMSIWSAKCNFGLTDEMVNDIRSTDGVEIFEVVSKYRFRIGIPDTFNVIKVQSKIERMLCGIIYYLSEKNLINRVVNHLIKKCEYEWVFGEADNVLYIKNKADNMKVIAVNVTI